MKLGYADPPYRRNAIGSLAAAMITRVIDGRLCATLPLLWCGVAMAEPPAGADPELAPWFRSLKDPVYGGTCCGKSDCRPTDYRITLQGYKVPFRGGWVLVPPERVLHQANPTGRAILCSDAEHVAPDGPLLIYCFVPDSQT